MRAALLAIVFALLPLRAVASAVALPDPETTLDEVRRVADWQLGHIRDYARIPQGKNSMRDPRDWQQAVFWVALTDLADRSGDPHYGQAVDAEGRQLGWSLGGRTYHADDHLIGQAWLWAASHGGGAAALVPTRERLDAILKDPPRSTLTFIDHGDNCTDRWCWADALFMAPPTWYGLSRATGDPRYAAYADREWQATANLLYDRQEHLFFRDSRFFDRRDAKGRKPFWSRGNGWVLAGLARAIPLMPMDDPERARMVALYRSMAERIISLQKGDGTWPPSLLETGPTPPESSGTGLFVAGLAWGVKAGLLYRRTAMPAIAKGWEALRAAVHPDGMVGWVQQISDRPDEVHFDDTQFYGSGAFVLAGCAIYDLTSKGGVH